MKLQITFILLLNSVIKFFILNSSLAQKASFFTPNLKLNNIMLYNFKKNPIYSNILHFMAGFVIMVQRYDVWNSPLDF